MTDTNLNPETLYQLYRQHRSMAAQLNASGSSLRRQSRSQSAPSLASLAYQRYKSIRLHSTDTPVDAIMTLIYAEQGVLNDDKETIDSVSHSEKHNLRSSAGSVVGFFRSAGRRLLDASVRPFDKSRFRIPAPAVVAALLAILVVPMMFDMGQPRNTFTSEDVEHYRNAAAFIEPSTGQNMGFTSGSIDVKNAFKLGLLSTQISVSTLGGESSKFDMVSQQLSMLIDAGVIEVLNKNLESVRSSMSTLVSLGMSEPDRTEAANKTLDELSVFQSTLRSVNTNNEDQLWFDLGEQIQAISLFAQLHSEHDMTNLLKNELAEFRNLPLPDETLMVKKPINELKGFSSKNTFNVDDTNEIISLCRHIKILML